MHRLVLDTNVVVSALLSPKGPPAAILEGVLEGRWRLLLSPDIFREYKEVLTRPELGFEARNVRLALSRLSSAACWVHPSLVVTACADPDDDILLTCAVDGAASHLVTGNLRHFPRGPFRGIQVLSPRSFLEEHGSHGESA